MASSTLSQNQLTVLLQGATAPVSWFDCTTVRWMNEGRGKFEVECSSRSQATRKLKFHRHERVAQSFPTTIRMDSKEGLIAGLLAIFHFFLLQVM
jgi:hypothetical protein